MVTCAAGHFQTPCIGQWQWIASLKVSLLNYCPPSSRLSTGNAQKSQEVRYGLQRGCSTGIPLVSASTSIVMCNMWLGIVLKKNLLFGQALRSSVYVH